MDAVRLSAGMIGGTHRPIPPGEGYRISRCGLGLRRGVQGRVVLPLSALILWQSYGDPERDRWIPSV